MQGKLLFLGLVALLSSSYFMQQSSVTIDTIPEHIVQDFTAFKQKFSKKYSGAEDNYRLQVYYDNYVLIQESNGNPENTFILGETQFMDLTKQEFKDMYLMDLSAMPPAAPSRSFNTNNLKGNADWRDRAVTRVKNQGGCGSCWTFSTTGALEGHAGVFGGGLREFSEQQILDCVREDYGCYGCGGGWPYQALRWVSEHGITDAGSYPYQGRQGNCQQSSGAYRTNGYVQVAADENQLKGAVEQQPISVCVDAGNWGLYRGGVFNQCGQGINHAVTLVGYNDEGWIVKNSWDTNWGETGYIRLSPGNTCGILGYAVYPN